MLSNQMPVHPEQSPRLTSHSGVPVREDAAFTNAKGVEKRGIRKRAEKALDQLQAPLRKILEPDEAVLYLASSQVVPDGIEQVMLGWYAMFLSRAELVLTNRRLLLLSINRNGGWTRGIRGAPWGDFEEAKVKGLFSPKLYLKYRDGTKEVYWGMKRDDSSKIQLLLESLHREAGGETSSVLAMTSYCPECRAALTRKIYECPQCRLQFKDEATALKRSILIPGGGFFYTGHYFLGLAHAVADLFLILYVLLMCALAMGIGSKPQDAGGMAVAAAVFIAILSLHKWLAVRVSRRLVRNFIPAT